jgi:hypothetical protein
VTKAAARHIGGNDPVREATLPLVTRRWPALALLLGAAACIEPPVTAPPAEVVIHLVDPVAWEGGDLVLTSNAFPDPIPLPAVLLDTLPLTVRRLDDSTIAARLPDTTGSFTVHVRVRNEHRFGPVRIVGFSGVTSARGTAGWPLPVEPGHPVVITLAESTLVLLDTRTGAETDLPVPHSAACAISPGRSFRPGAVVAQGAVAYTCQRPLAWTLGASVTPVDSAPSLVSGANLWAELAPGTWLEAAHHYVYLHVAGARVLEERIESTERAVLSPDGSAVIPLAASTETRIPVLDVASATVRFRLPLQSSDGAAFTPDGDTLFVAGIADYTTNVTTHLVAASAATGAVVADSAFHTGGLSDLILDPDGPWLYVLAYDAVDGDHLYWGPVVHVFDRRTLHELAVLRPPPTVGCGSLCFLLTLSIDPQQRKLYVLRGATWRGPAPRTSTDAIYTFDLPPGTQTPQQLGP